MSMAAFIPEPVSDRDRIQFFADHIHEISFTGSHASADGNFIFRLRARKLYGYGATFLQALDETIRALRAQK